jgi:hypothetical protein
MFISSKARYATTFSKYQTMSPTTSDLHGQHTTREFHMRRYGGASAIPKAKLAFGVLAKSKNPASTIHYQ